MFSLGTKLYIYLSQAAKHYLSNSLWEPSCTHLHIKYYSLMSQSIRTRVMILYYNTSSGHSSYFQVPFYIHSTLDRWYKSALRLFIALLRPQRQPGWNIQGTGKVLLLLTHSLWTFASRLYGADNIYMWSQQTSFRSERKNCECTKVAATLLLSFMLPWKPLSHLIQLQYSFLRQPCVWPLRWGIRIDTLPTEPLLILLFTFTPSRLLQALSDLPPNPANILIHNETVVTADQHIAGWH